MVGDSSGHGSTLVLASAGECGGSGRETSKHTVPCFLLGVISGSDAWSCCSYPVVHVALALGRSQEWGHLGRELRVTSAWDPPTSGLEVMWTANFSWFKPSDSRSFLPFSFFFSLLLLVFLFLVLFLVFFTFCCQNLSNWFVTQYQSLIGLTV